MADRQTRREHRADYEKDRKDRLKLPEIADRIREHLKRFEADSDDDRFCWHPHAYHAGPKVMVTYVSYQGPSSLTKAEAIAYLDWLDAGNVGRHFEQQREAGS